MLHNAMIFILLSLISILNLTLLTAVTLEEDAASFILVPHGLSPDDAERIIIPAGNSSSI